MPKPSDWQLHQITRPKSDNEYFEIMSRIILAAGLNWQVINQKWPGIKEAFAGFVIKKVAKFQEPEIEELLMNPDVIRNLAKIRAIIANAQELLAIQKDYGDFASYLATLNKGSEDQLRAEISKRFAFLGPGTTVLFLYSVGEDIPKATKEWRSRHS